MLETINLPLIMITALIGVLSPGPATLAIAGASMTSGRKYSLALASGISTASLIWSLTAAFGMGALMFANAWAFEIIRYFGAGYLIFLACKSARSAIKPGSIEANKSSHFSLKQAFAKGMAIHMTNPKVILFFGSLYAIGVPSNASPKVLAIVIIAIAIQSTFFFHAYAIIFSSPPIMRGYLRMRRGFEGLFAVAFAAAGLKILTTKIS